MLTKSLLIAGISISGLALTLSPIVEQPTPEVPGNRIFSPADLPKAESTGEWLAGAVRYLEDGDRIEGSAMQVLFDPAELTDGAGEVKELMDAVEYLEVEKSDRDKVKLVAFLKGEENIKRKWMVEGKEAKVTMRHQKTRILLERLSSSKVMVKVRGIGAAWGAKPIPEGLMRLTIKGNELELMEVAGFDVDSDYDLELPAELLLSAE